MVPAQTFSSVDRNALRKPNRFILSNVAAQLKKKPTMANWFLSNAF
jgi:hypothetical protein